MVDRYWVGGTNTWNTSTARWSATDGGASGVSIPTASDRVFFTAASGAVTVTTSGSAVGRSINFTGFTGTFAGTNNISIGDGTAGTNVFSSGMTLTWNGNFRIASTTTGNTLTTNGKTMPGAIVINGVGGDLILQDNLTVTNGITLTNGTFNTNAKTVTTSIMSLNNTNTRVLTITNSTINCNQWASTGSGMTVNASGSTIIMNSTSSVPDFNGGGYTYNNVQLFAKTGIQPTVIDSNFTCSLLTLSATGGVAVVFSIVNGVTITFSTLSANGTLGNLLSIISNLAGTAVNFSCPSGTISCDYLVLKDNHAAGGASFYAGANSTNVSGNTGWTFTAPPAPSGVGSYYTRFLAGDGNV